MTDGTERQEGEGKEPLDVYVADRMNVLGINVLLRVYNDLTTKKMEAIKLFTPNPRAPTDLPRQFTERYGELSGCQSEIIGHVINEFGGKYAGMFEDAISSFGRGR